MVAPDVKDDDVGVLGTQFHEGDEFVEDVLGEEGDEEDEY